MFWVHKTFLVDDAFNYSNFLLFVELFLYSDVSTMQNIITVNIYWLDNQDSLQFSCLIILDSLRLHGLQHARPPCPSPTPKVYSNSCPLSWWCHPTTSSSVIPFFSGLQSFPAPGSLQMSRSFTSGGQNIGVSASASVLPVNIQGWFPLGWTGLNSLLSKGL